MPNEAPAILWFRSDLRLSDNPALRGLCDLGRPIVPLFIFDEAGEGDWPFGAASKWWLHHSLKSLDGSLRGKGSQLVLRKGDAEKVLSQLVEELGAKAVYWNRRYEPAVVERDTHLKKKLADSGIEVKSFNGSLLQSPLSITNKSGSPFKVFTPFWKHMRTLNTRETVEKPKRIASPNNWPQGDDLDDWKLLPTLDWDAGFYDEWEPGEAGAKKVLDSFSRSRVGSYSEDRDNPATNGVSRLSPHLHFGELSPNQIWSRLNLSEHEPYLRQVGWREFAHHLLFHFKDTADKPLRKEFERFPWKRNKRRLEAWQKGQTGYPIVDAGMRELWSTGWMHNRVRMVVASFLVKHLLQPWQDGARWFWDTLVDADLANNTMGWQWVAGCGADAAPYFRIFNPITQGERFDEGGAYTRKWVPELSKLPDRYLFQPWEAPESVLSHAGVKLGENYPKPIIAHKEGREAALAAYEKVKAG